MAIHANVLLHIPVDHIRKALEPHKKGGGRLRGANGEPLRVRELEDSSIVCTHAPFGSEPAELAAVLRSLLGALVDDHADDRGIYVFPDVAKPKTRTYDDVVDELGEVGFWVSEAEAGAPAIPGSFDASMQDLMSNLPDGALGQLEQAMAGGDFEALAELSKKMEAGIGDREAVLDTMKEDPAGAAQQVMDQVREMMGGMAGADGLDMSKLPMGLPSQQDAPGLWALARQQAATLMENPEQLAALAEQFGLPVDALQAEAGQLAGQETADAPPADDAASKGDDPKSK